MLHIAIIEDEQIHTELLSGYLHTWSKELSVYLGGNERF